MHLYIREIKDKQDKKKFLQLPIVLYKNQKNWIRPLDADIEKVFDKKRNKYFRNGTATRWLLEDGKGHVIGRIAAFIDFKSANKKNDQPTGGVGFFECINNKEAANLLFDTGKQWLEDQGMEAMDGPINFGDRNENWGLHVEGDFPPNYGMPYHFAYYKELFENYGFQTYFRQITYKRKITPSYEGFSQKIIDKSEKLLKDPNYSFRHIKMSNINNHSEEFRTIYNKAWAGFTGLGPMSKPQAQSIINKLRKVIDEKLFWVGYYKEEPIAMFLMLPELNQIFKSVNGKMNWWGKLVFLFLHRRKTITTALGTLFGVVPEHQGKGAESAIIMAFADMVKETKNFQYKDIEMNWIGDFNPKMIRIVEQIGGKEHKIHHTYRYLFDRTKEFKRMPKH
ncbi:MAG: hypothetical protein U9R32_00955 [Bacteroidota bacterium]|nr:hypothetical protein [Bacteroidota bacterium]